MWTPRRVALLVATTLFLPELLASLGNDDDVWLFVATSGVLVVNAFLSMMFMDGLGNALSLGPIEAVLLFQLLG